MKKIYNFLKDKPMARVVVNCIASFFIAYLLFTFVFTNGNTTEQISYSEFLNMIDDSSITDVQITDNEIRAKAVNGNKLYKISKMEDNNLVDKLHKANISFEKIDETPGPVAEVIVFLVRLIFPTLLLFYLFSKFMNKGPLNGASFMKKSEVPEDIMDISFEDVAGQDEAKEQLSEIISFLHEPEKYKEIGAKIPKGALLIGPPGGGKTLLAKAVAGEANVPFISVSGSDFVELYVGMGAKKVREMFAEAKKDAPCIIFIDEVDSIAKSRNSTIASGGNDEREQTLNQLLSEMDGFDPYAGIIVLAATNRPETLDKAFVRAGRFDRKITINIPDVKERLAILKVHTKNKQLAEDVDLQSLANSTVGAVGADLANIVNEAAIRAVKMKRDKITQEDLNYAFEFLIAGAEKKNKILSEKERELVAYHELGHAIVAAIQTNTDPVQKITIVPRTSGALGYTLQSPKNDEYLTSKDKMIAEVMSLLGGRAAEEVKFSEITTGASNDLERATDIIRRMITVYGMSSDIGPVSLERNVNSYLGDQYGGNISNELANKVDNLVQEKIKFLYDKTKKLIKNNMDIMNALAKVLLVKETISGEEFMDIFSKMYTAEKKLVDQKIISSEFNDKKFVIDNSRDELKETPVSNNNVSKNHSENSKKERLIKNNNKNKKINKSNSSNSKSKNKQVDKTDRNYNSADKRESDTTPVHVETSNKNTFVEKNKNSNMDTKDKNVDKIENENNKKSAEVVNAVKENEISEVNTTKEIIKNNADKIVPNNNDQDIEKPEENKNSDLNLPKKTVSNSYADKIKSIKMAQEKNTKKTTTLNKKEQSLIGDYINSNLLSDKKDEDAPKINKDKPKTSKYTKDNKNTDITEDMF